MLTIHQLQVFVTVAEAGSVRSAAERLYVSQPAVSASLAALEREMGVGLVGRSGRGIELTEAGRLLEQYARRVLVLVDEARAAVRGEPDPGLDLLRLGAVTAADHLVAPLLAQLRTVHPQLGIALEVGNRDRIWQLLAERGVDVALAGRPPSTGELVSLATRPHQMVLVARPGSVWAGNLAEATWMLREPGSGTRAATEEVMAALGMSPPTVTVGSSGAIQAAAEAGLGVALLPRDAVADALRTRALAVVHTSATPLPRAWHIVVRSGERLRAPVRQFVDDLVGAGSGFEPAR